MSSTTNRTIVHRLRRYLAFSWYRNLRLTRSTWLLVRTRVHAGLFSTPLSYGSRLATMVYGLLLVIES